MAKLKKFDPPKFSTVVDKDGFDYTIRNGFNLNAGGAVALPLFNGNNKQFPYSKAYLKRIRSSFVFYNGAIWQYVDHLLYLGFGQGQYIDPTTFGVPTPAGTTDLAPSDVASFHFTYSNPASMEVGPFLFSNSQPWNWQVQSMQTSFALGNILRYQLDLTFRVLDK